MIRAMSRVAEAQRVRSARLIEASAEYEASLKLVQAGRQYAAAPFSLRLREMQNYAQIAAEKNMMIIPSSLDSGVAGALETLSQRLRFSDERGVGQKGDVREVEKEKVETQVPDKDTKNDGSDKAPPKRGTVQPQYLADDEDD